MSEGERKAQLIDIEEIIKSKSPNLLNRLPRFIINYIKRILHQDDVNYILEKHKDSTGVDFASAVVDEFNVNVILNGEENIPKNGRFIFASNHPLGGLEGIVFISVISKLFNKIRFPVNDLLLNLKNFHPVFIPINKHGKNSRSVAKLIEDAYNSDAQILYFPAGLVSRRIKGKVRDLTWKKNFISKAIQHQRDIVPVYIDGRNSNFFYNLSSFRKFLGIKANIEMFFLINEMDKQRNKTLRLTIGKPISYQVFDKTKSMNDWAEHVKNIVYKLQDV